MGMLGKLIIIKYHWNIPEYLSINEIGSRFYIFIEIPEGSTSTVLNLYLPYHILRRATGRFRRPIFANFSLPQF
jgi:hypothetical protein